MHPNIQRIISLIQSSPERMATLEAVARLKLPDCWVAAGFVRNMVWDDLHSYAASALNDVDVIYFDKDNNIMPKEIERQLAAWLPDINWQVKNQATMHIRNKDKPYLSSADAMTYWPEKETAIGVRLSNSTQVEVCAPFGTASLFNGCITYNPKRTRAVFDKRVADKRWLTHWPKLRLCV